MPRLCVIISMATPRRRERLFISSRIWAWMLTSRAVVGSSARTSEGSHASAIAIIMRCRMPPLNWCGYWTSRRAGSGMPTIESSSAARARAAVGVISRCVSRPSVIWRPIVSTGLSDVIGSWKIIAISRPRTRRIASSSSESRSRPLKRMRPATMRPAGAATSRMIESALTDLPQPDSPTSATVSPSATSHDTPSTARTTPPRVTNCVWRSITSRRVPTARGSLARGAASPGRGAPRLRRGAAEHSRSRSATAPPGRCRAFGVEERHGFAGALPSVGESEGPARGPSATTSSSQIGYALGQRRVLAADRLGDARPAVLRSPALALAAQPPAQGAVAEHARDARGQRAGIALGDEQPRHAVAHRALQTAHPGGDDGAAAGHRLQRHHPERLVVRGQHRDVGGDVPVAQALLRLRADEADGVAEAERGRAAADVGLVPIRRLVGLAADHGKVRGRAGAAQTAGGVEPVALDGVGGHQPVGGGDDAPLLGDAQRGLALGGDAGAVLEGAERVE